VFETLLNAPCCTLLMSPEDITSPCKPTPANSDTDAVLSAETPLRAQSRRDTAVFLFLAFCSLRCRPIICGQIIKMNSCGNDSKVPKRLQKYIINKNLKHFLIMRRHASCLFTSCLILCHSYVMTYEPLL
jgi:hypothetical protein